MEGKIRNIGISNVRKSRAERQHERPMRRQMWRPVSELSSMELQAREDREFVINRMLSGQLRWSR